MKILTKVGAAVLAGMLAGGCSSPRPQMRFRAPGVAEIARRPAIQEPVEVSEGDFREAMRALTADAGILRARLPKRSLVRLASLDEQQQVLGREYLSCCQRSMGMSDDCLSVLNGSLEFDDDARQAVALDVALSGALTEAADALGAVTPLQLRVMVLSAMVGYMALILIPEPISKLIAIVLTCNMIAYLGVDLFNSVVLGYHQMRQQARQARSMEELVRAGRLYGERLGPSVGRLVVMLATLGMARVAGVVPPGAPQLPGAVRAAAMADAHGFTLAAVAEVQTVTRAVDGSVTLAMAMSNTAAVGSTGDPSPEPAKPQISTARAAERTVRTAPRNLAEKLALDEARAGAGRRIMQGQVKDPKYPENVWAKMEHVHQHPDGTQTVVHYWQNLKTGAREGFKFK